VDVAVEAMWITETDRDASQSRNQFTSKHVELQPDRRNERACPETDVSFGFTITPHAMYVIRVPVMARATDRRQIVRGENKALVHIPIVLQLEIVLLQAPRPICL
jgi:hypothetical protein